MGSWRELTGESLRTFAATAPTTINVFLYTPTCGHCRVARQVIDHALQALPAETVVVAGNLNLTPQVAVDWQVERLPALVEVEGGLALRKTYDFHSINEIAAWLQ